MPVGDVAFKLMPNASYTWHEASDACTNNDAFLAVVDTSERKQAVHEIMETAGNIQKPELGTANGILINSCN